MKKILAVFDGVKYSEGASKYAIEMARATGSMVIGAFIQDLRFINFTYAYTFDQPFIDFNAIQSSKQEELDKIDLNIKLFKGACEDKGVHYKVHFDKGVPVQEVIKESEFADVLIIDSHAGLYSFGGNNAGPFLKDLLADSHCPVMVVPHQYTSFNKAILCYDGSPSSTYAIKMFAYLFPELSNIETTVVAVNEKSGNHLKDGSNLKDLVKQHYNNVNYEVLHGNAEEELVKYLQKENNAIIVMGAYGRNALSRFFYQSLSIPLIKELNLPVFSTHQ